jgi:NADH dehydrogenase [ubiquinone] 1 alpha subcomplex assembly factor 5
MKPANQITVFDRRIVRLHRQRAAANFASHNALFTEIADQLIERLTDIKQEFKTALNLDPRDNYLTQKLKEHGITDIATPEVFKENEILPFAPASFDLIISNLNLHWVNDLPGLLTQIKNALKPKGLFLAALIGGNSLHELRSCLMDAEIAISKGASPRLSPTIDLQTASSLLQRAGFSLPVTDNEIVTLTYPDIYMLMRDLRGMGESNAHIHRLRNFTPKRLFDAANRLYQTRFGATEGQIAATFDIIFLHGTNG